MTDLGSDKDSPYLRAKPSWFKRAKRNPFFSFLWDLVAIVLGALVLSLLVKTFLIRSFFIPSASMEKTLMVDDRIIVNELSPNLFPIQRGDIMVFRDPGGWLTDQPAPQTNFLVDSWDLFLSVFGITAPDSDDHLVKRVIGLPGDHIVGDDVTGEIIINGETIIEPYIIEGDATCMVDAKDNQVDHFDVVVPKDSYWMMGDNRGNSADSRCHTNLPSKGFVNRSLMVGRAFILSFPFNRFTWLDNYPDVFKDVPKP